VEQHKQQLVFGIRTSLPHAEFLVEDKKDKKYNII
jgi:hypothetical protein